MALLVPMVELTCSMRCWRLIPSNLTFMPGSLPSRSSQPHGCAYVAVLMTFLATKPIATPPGAVPLEEEVHTNALLVLTRLP